MFATMWDRFSEDPWGFILLGLAIAIVFLAIERIFRIVMRRREIEEGSYTHRTANELPRTLAGNGSAAVTKLEDDVEKDEVIR